MQNEKWKGKTLFSLSPGATSMFASHIKFIFHSTPFQTIKHFSLLIAGSSLVLIGKWKLSNLSGKIHYNDAEWKPLKSMHQKATFCHVQSLSPGMCAVLLISSLFITSSRSQFEHSPQRLCSKSLRGNLALVIHKHFHFFAQNLPIETTKDYASIRFTFQWNFSIFLSSSFASNHRRST